MQKMTVIMVDPGAPGSLAVECPKAPGDAKEALKGGPQYTTDTAVMLKGTSALLD